jgi:hypothetical protein
MDLSRFTREELILAGVAILPVFDLLFLPWFEVSIGLGSLELSTSSTGTGAPDGWLGVLAVLACLALVADLALARFGDVPVAAIAGSRASTRLRRGAWTPVWRPSGAVPSRSVRCTSRGTPYRGHAQ